MANLQTNPNATSNLTNWSKGQSSGSTTLAATTDGGRWVGTATGTGRYLQIRVPSSQLPALPAYAMLSLGPISVRRNSGTANITKIQPVGYSGGNIIDTSGIAWTQGTYVKCLPIGYWAAYSNDGHFDIRIYVEDGKPFSFHFLGMGVYDSGNPASPDLDLDDAKWSYSQGNNSLTASFQYLPGNEAANALTWTWDHGGSVTGTKAAGSTTNGIVTSHTFPAPGVYNVKMKARAEYSYLGGFDEYESATKAITVPVGPFSAGFNYETDWLNVAVDASASIAPSLSPIDTYAWNWGDGQTTAANPSKLASHSYAAPGAYNVTLTVHDTATNRTATHTKTITVLSPPSTELSFTASKQLLTVAFIPSVLDGTSYAWDFGDGNTSTDQSPTHVYASPGTYTVTLTVDALDPATQDVTVTDVYTPLGSLMDALRLEVAIPKTGVRNLLPNPSGDLGAWGWWTTATNSYLTGSVTADQPADKGVTGAKLVYRSSGAGEQWVHSAQVRAVAGKYAAVQVNVPYVDGYYRIRLRALDAAGTVLGYSTLSGYQQASPTAVVRSGPYLLPANTVAVQMSLRHVANTSDGVPTVNKLLVFRRAMLAVADTSDELASIPYSEGTDWQDLIGPTSEISITREALNLGTLTATILDSTFDPAVSGTIRPKQTCRLRVKTPDESGNVRWQPIFTGQVGDPEVEYVPAKGIVDSPKLTRIKLTAYDAVRTLAQWERSEGVAKIKELPEILEGVPVPYEVNGSTGQVPSASIVNANDNASVLDQVAITRDSDGGYAFVDRAGVLIVREPEFMPATPVGVIDEAVYSGINAGFNLADTINSVTIKWLRYIPAAGTDPASVEEAVYGPYEDNASIDEWDIRPATFTMLGVENPTAIAARAAEILAANAQPARMITGVTIPIRYLEDLSADKALLDLYDLVRLGYQRTETDELIRVTSIHHTITPRQWLMDLGFSADGAVASPQVVAAPPVSVSPYDTGWVTISPASGYGSQAGYPLQIRRVGNLVKTRGLLTKTGGFTANSNLTDVTTAVAAEFRPSQGEFFVGAANVNQVPSTLIVNPTGTLTVRTGSTVVSWVGIAASWFTS